MRNEKIKCWTDDRRMKIASSAIYGLYLKLNIHRFGYDRDDLRQEALLGIMHAERTWQVRRGNFETYAYLVARSRAIQFIRDQHGKPGQTSRRLDVSVLYDKDMHGDFQTHPVYHENSFSLLDGLDLLMKTFQRLPGERRSCKAYKSREAMVIRLCGGEYEDIDGSVNLRFQNVSYYRQRMMKYLQICSALNGGADGYLNGVDASNF